MLNKSHGGLRLSNSKFVKNVATLVSGTAFAQVVAIVSTPIVTRLYGPEMFGVAGTFASVLTIIYPLLAMAYPFAIVLPKQDDEALKLANICRILSFSIATTLVLLIAIYSLFAEAHYFNSFPTIYLLLVPIASLILSELTVREQLATRYHKFKVRAKSTVFASLTVSIMKIALGFLYASELVLVASASIQNAIKYIYIGMAEKITLTNREKKKHSLSDLLHVANKYSSFPKYRLPEIIVNSASQSVPVVFIMAKFGPAYAGFYTLSKSMLTVPITLISNSVGEVIYPKLAEKANNNHRLTPIVLKSTATLFALGLLPFLLVGLYANEIFAFAFGSEWEKAGSYASWIALWTFFLFINNPSVKLLQVINKQKFQMLFSFLTITLRLVAMYSGYYFFESDIAAVALFCLSGAIVNVALITISCFMCLKYDERVFNG